MDADAKAKEMLAKVSELARDWDNLVGAVKGLIDKAVETFSGPILECADEAEFLTLVAALGDELYVGNALTERIDGLVFKQALGLLDKFVLDKMLGSDWFVVLQAKAKAFQDAVKAAGPGEVLN